MYENPAWNTTTASLAVALLSLMELPPVLSRQSFASRP